MKEAKLNELCKFESLRLWSKSCEFCLTSWPSYKVLPTRPVIRILKTAGLTWDSVSIWNLIWTSEKKVQGQFLESEMETSKTTLFEPHTHWGRRGHKFPSVLKMYLKSELRRLCNYVVNTFPNGMLFLTIEGVQHRKIKLEECWFSKILHIYVLAVIDQAYKN